MNQSIIERAMIRNFNKKNKAAEDHRITHNEPRCSPEDTAIQAANRRLSIMFRCGFTFHKGGKKNVCNH